MLDVFTPLLKLFANEPLERLICTIIIFGLTLWLVPKEFIVAFNVYTETPWLFQIIVFAFSFAVTISFSRLRTHIQKRYSLLLGQRILFRLSEKEIAIFEDFLKTGNLIITSSCRNPVMKKLERKGIIQHQNDSANCSYYLVTEKYFHLMKLFWNSRSRRFNR